MSRSTRAPTWSASYFLSPRRGTSRSRRRACWESACAAGRKKSRSRSMPTTPGSMRSSQSLRPDMLQLHGKETAARVTTLKQRFGLPAMKAVPIAQKGDLALAANYIAVADRILFDARAPKDATRPGGLGKAFNWRLLKNLALGVPFMLSGGLDAGNVGEALRVTKAPGVDVSSGVERAPGEKDPDKIRAFIRAARKAAFAALPGGEKSPAPSP